MYRKKSFPICRRPAWTGLLALLPLLPAAAEEPADDALDTISAARALRDKGCDVVITLGGDGTNRAFALGWRDAPLIPISTGTNNVFPVLCEATVAGAAAGGRAHPHNARQSHG